MADIVLINPRFEISFWGLERALPFLGIGKRANVPVAALPLLAALTPVEHQVTLIDENVEEIDFDRCARADIVGVTGMVVQRQRMREILITLKERGAFVVVGGPWITVNEGYFDGLADVKFIGEAEDTWPRFLEEWQCGTAGVRYEQAEKTDMTRVPPPRLDLLKLKRYAFGSVQFSRGCPFQCEFCDIIVVFGRRPRLKTSAQVTVELDGLRDSRVPIVFIVDDNLIGNKKAIKPILRDVIAWQTANNYPLIFFTEASIDLADDSELMELMAQANIGCVFVGIESPNEDSLRETRKLQNLRAGGTLLEKIGRIQSAGMEVCGGMIVGFDNDDANIFETQRQFIQASRIPIAMIGMLSAIPKTPLFDRLAAAGRLDDDDQPALGTNVLPLQMTREELSDGYVRLMTELYDTKAYFERLDDLYLNQRIVLDRGWHDFARHHPWRRFWRQARAWIEAFGLMGILSVKIADRALSAEYRRRFANLVRIRREPMIARTYALRCAMHYHAQELVRVLQMRDVPTVNTY
jgi:radical SAM superfamily enzyme YgiQ (UPF0313 family)